MIRTFKSKALRKFWTADDESGLRPDWIKKTSIILDGLNASSTPDDMNLPGLRFHALRGNRAGDYAVTVSRNWRITFRWDGRDAIDVDLEDYHGS